MVGIFPHHVNMKYLVATLIHIISCTGLDSNILKLDEAGTVIGLRKKGIDRQVGKDQKTNNKRTE